jgi:hypothetical protein
MSSLLIFIRYHFDIIMTRYQHAIAIAARPGNGLAYVKWLRPIHAPGQLCMESGQTTVYCSGDDCAHTDAILSAAEAGQ